MRDLTLSPPTSVVPVLVPVAVDRAYSYICPGDQLPAGTIVRVPLGPRSVIGAVWRGESDKKIDVHKLRQIEEIFDVPAISDDLMEFVDWVARYTLASPGMVLRMVLRMPAALSPEPVIRGVRRSGPPPSRMTSARNRVLQMLAENDFSWSRSGLVAAAGVSASVVDGLVNAGTLEMLALPAAPPRQLPDPSLSNINLNRDQADAADHLKLKVKQQSFSVSLLDGVTGSGKTEVYLEAVAQCLTLGRQVLILLPEIALTGEFLNRFESRFGARPGEWHSDVPAKTRERLWRDLIFGKANLVIGARSALYLPFPDLGLIIVDEEHDGAYKQDDRVIYNARDMAVVRAKTCECPVVLASATPSVESWANALSGKYHRLELSSRIGDATLPAIDVIDMTKKPPAKGRFLSPDLVDAMADAVEGGRQSLLFLNRRGYAPLTLCRSCGHRFHCGNCSAWLVEHRFRSSLNCHHCGHIEPRPEACPQCGDLDSLTACGPGVERIGDEVAELFPNARTLVLSSDLPGGTERMRRLFADIAKGETDIIIGTQLIAKGHNFPLLSVVGVVDADLGLTNGDPRAAERSFQLLSQVTGRAGRTTTNGRGLIQTYNPNHPVISSLASGNRVQFYGQEIEGRKRAGLPPYARLAAILISGPDPQATLQYARALRKAVPTNSDVDIFGPAEAPLAMLRGRHRFRILLRAARGFDMQNYVRHWLHIARKPKGAIRLSVDIDPQSFL